VADGLGCEGLEMSALVRRALMQAAKRRSVQAADPYFANVALLMHMNDTGLTDVKGKTIALNGNLARVADAEAYGGYAAEFDASGDYATVSPAISLAAGDFTIETRFKNDSITADTPLISRRANGIGYLFHAYRHSTTQYRVVFQQWNAVTTYAAVAHIFDDATDGYKHAAACRVGNIVTLFYQGSKAASELNTGNRPGDPGVLTYIGQDSAAPGTSVNGRYEEIRITLGVARYTANFTPPTEPFPDF
jgi:hypothetical protein